MNLKKMTLASLFIAIGFIFRMITPGVFLGMKPDFLLAMMFLTILINDDYKMTILVGGVVGILTAVTTTFPGGQIPNIIDKLITCQCIFLAFKLTKKINNQFRVPIIAFFGTMLSGTLFLTAASILVGLPKGASFSSLFMVVVIPASIGNTVISVIMYNAIFLALKRSSLNKKLFDSI